MAHWFEQTAADVPPADDWLGNRERIALAGLRIPKRRADWRLGRWTAKRAIAARLAVALPDIEVLPAPGGAPRAFVFGRPAALAVSISHSNGVGCCALRDGSSPLGCDIERIEPRSAAFRGDYFTADEFTAFGSDPPPDVVTLFWSAKESVLKALETGLRGDPRSIAVTPDFSVVTGSRWKRLRACVVGYPPFEGFWRADSAYVRTVLEVRINDRRP